ncbi:MAG TPA: KamA family radical SAM protein [Kiritimatiellia bacterium]|nr:KamA family radical SAM protein [Kiritimatiellia bacterium]HMO98067.1 KamA family radical SAM protein [Kiritimatiellia bacterium]HMP98079.1 KamA family radical SAM protein [Kiritimatiellia bacterium]
MDGISRVFKRRFFPAATTRDWRDWRWQLKHRLRDREGLAAVFELTADEEAALARLGDRLPVGLSPYYASRVASGGPLRATVIPATAEFVHAPGEYTDPLGEDAHHPVPGLIHTYPDKVLFLVTDFCATYCRYCMRSRLVGQGTFLPDPRMWEEAFAYIQAHPEVRDVLLSGGDPLILADDRLDYLLRRLKAIPHVEFIRIGTKVPMVLPQRITPALCRMLKKYHPLFMSIHIIHPDELAPEAVAACERLADAGIPLGGQMVLLRGVNDTPEVMRTLVHAQLRARVKPYYLHQCDAIIGSMHFRTPVQTGVDLLRSLHGHTTGYAVPMYMIDAPGGGGKVPVSPDYRVGSIGEDLVLENYAGKKYRYRDPGLMGKQAVQTAGRASTNTPGGTAASPSIISSAPTGPHPIARGGATG